MHEGISKIEEFYGPDAARIFSALESKWKKDEEDKILLQKSAASYQAEKQRNLDAQIEALNEHTERQRQERLKKEEQVAKEQAQWEYELDRKCKMLAYDEGEMAYCVQHSKELEPLHDRCQNCTRFAFCWSKKVKELIHNAKK